MSPKTQPPPCAKTKPGSTSPGALPSGRSSRARTPEGSVMSRASATSGEGGCSTGRPAAYCARAAGGSSVSYRGLFAALETSSRRTQSG
jgi:hypothetical protein